MAKSLRCQPRGHARLEVQLDKSLSKKAVDYINGTKFRRRNSE